MYIETKRTSERSRAMTILAAGDRSEDPKNLITEPMTEHRDSNVIGSSEVRFLRNRHGPPLPGGILNG